MKRGQEEMKDTVKASEEKTDCNKLHSVWTGRDHHKSGGRCNVDCQPMDTGPLRGTECNDWRNTAGVTNVPQYVDLKPPWQDSAKDLQDEIVEVFIEPLASNGRLYWLHYSAFQVPSQYYIFRLIKYVYFLLICAFHL
jgi:hypothetical protein